jgi:hypothetical protein
MFVQERLAAAMGFRPDYSCLHSTAT